MRLDPVSRSSGIQTSAHAHLVHLFADAGVPIVLGNSVSNKGDIQWMVREKYGLALIDELLPLEADLTTRPISGVNWSVEGSFCGQQER